MKLEVRYWKQGSCSRGDVDILTEGPETADDVRSGLRSSEAVEEGRTQFPVGGVAAEDEVGGAEPICSDSETRASGPQSQAAKGGARRTPGPANLRA